MRWNSKKHKPHAYERHLVYRFAWLPITIKGETRWLERCPIWAHFWIGGVSGRKYWEYEEFADE